MARTFDSSQFSLQIDPSHKISKNLNFDPRAVALLRTFPRYQERLVTFNAIKWHSKPPTLSPPFCALYGWHVTDVDVLRCTECDEVLYGHLPYRNAPNYPSRLDSILTGLITNHAELCAFRTNHEPFEFFKRDDSSYLFKNRLLSFPPFVELPHLVAEVDADFMTELIENFGAFVENKAEMKKIISLSLYGWNYQVVPDQPRGNLESEDDVRVISIDRYLENDRPFDCAQEHRTWSIWLNSYTVPDLGLIYNGITEIFKIGTSDDAFGEQKLSSILRDEIADNNAKISRKRPPTESMPSEPVHKLIEVSSILDRCLADKFKT